MTTQQSPDMRRGRKRSYTPEQRKAWNFMTRYKLTAAEVQAMALRQDGLCAICGKAMSRVCVDHSHTTGMVRGLLCHPCNVALHAIENEGYLEKATAYLKKWG